MADEDMIDDGLDLEEASFDDFDKKKKQTLGDLWRDSPVVKIGVVAAAGAAIFGTIIIFGGKEVPMNPSYVGEGAEISAPPGTEDASPAYVGAVEEENEARLTEAQQTGDSSIPTPIGPPLERPTITEEEAPEEDPLQRWRKLQEERLQREMLRSQTVAPEVVEPDTGQTEAVQALAAKMAEQMQSILAKQNEPKNIQTKAMTGQGWLDSMHEKEVKKAEAAAAAVEEKVDLVEVVLYPAASIAYGQILIEANSDVPGPVMAMIASGPLTGSKMLGSFSKQKETLTVKFDQIIVDGESIGINGIMIDPETTLPAMATDVDYHYIKRIVLPAAAAFVGGMASAIAESGRTDVTVTGETVSTETEAPSEDEEVATGVQEAGDEIRDIIDEMNEDIEVTVRIEVGTRIGILFLEPVLKPVEDI